MRFGLGLSRLSRRLRCGFGGNGQENQMGPQIHIIKQHLPDELQVRRQQEKRLCAAARVETD